MIDIQLHGKLDVSANKPMIYMNLLAALINTNKILEGEIYIN